MPGMIGLDGLSTMLEQADAPPIALISGVASREVAQRALEAGAMGFLPKTLSATDLVKAVNLMIEGTRYMPAEFKLPRPDGKAAPDALLGQLSQRELQVWHGLSRGKSNKEIARDLEVQETTVKLHVKTLYRKLGVANRTQAAILATEHGVF
jgi:DNA-binding NarL/FixJ family response regulator